MEIKREHNLSIIIIMETKLVGHKASEVVQSLRWLKWEVVDADGPASGIWLL